MKSSKFWMVPWRDRKGAIALLVALGLVSMMLVAGMVVDVGFWLTKKAQLQGIADMAAMSSMGGVDTSQGVLVQQAQAMLLVRKVESLNDLSSGFFDVTIGTTPSVSPTQVSTVEVRHTESMPTFFWKVFGMNSVSVPISARAENARITATIPPCGFFSKNDVTYGGGGNEEIDSYDSRDGTYSSAPTQTYNGVPYKKNGATGCANGDFLFNGGTAMMGDIYANGVFDTTGSSGTIHGDVRVNGSISTDYTISGTQDESANNPVINIPNVTTPPNISNSSGNDNDCCVRLHSVSGMTTTITNYTSYTINTNGQDEIHVDAGGTYYFSSIDMGGSQKFVIDGTPSAASPTKIYVDGPTSLLGGVSFASSSTVTAEMIKFYGLSPGSDGDTFELGGNPDMTADLYLPNMNFELHGDVTLKGTIWANSIDIDGTAHFVYDEALGSKPMTTDSYTLRTHLTR